MGSKNKRLEGDIDNNDKDSRLSKKHRKDREEKGQLEGYGWYMVPIPQQAPVRSETVSL